MSDASPASTLHVAFVLTSNGRDIYTQRARLAIASLRLVHPDARITLACDTATAKAPDLARSGLLEQTDELLQVDTPDGAPAFRSRFVKTSLPTRIAGPFLFLDLDVLVRAPLQAVRTTGADVAAVLNHCTADPRRQVGKPDRAILQAMGWSHREGQYLNTGVIHFSGTAACKAFAEQWHQRWLASSATTGNHLDQPAFNSALLVMPGVTRHVLPDAFNAQVRRNLWSHRGAAVWHFYSAKEEPFTGFDAEAERLKRGAVLDLDRVMKLMRAAHPWKVDGPLDRAVLAHAFRQGFMPARCRLWLQGHRWRAAGAFVRWVWNSVFRR
jgi:hypothetical protein